MLKVILVAALLTGAPAEPEPCAVETATATATECSWQEVAGLVSMCTAICRTNMWCWATCNGAALLACGGGSSCDGQTFESNDPECGIPEIVRFERIEGEL